MADYKETTVAGTSWQRAHHVVIENPYGQPPKITFGEQQIFNVNGEQIVKFVGADLSVSYDSSNPKHVSLYTALNELYTELRTARDSVVE